MKIACITTSVIPSKSANSIQAMKVVHALHESGQDVHLWAPEFEKSQWEEIEETYGLRSRFGITWLRFLPFARQYDFAWKSVSAARRWGAEVIYTWALQAAVMAQLRGLPAVMEFHDFPMGRMGPRLFRIYASSKAKKISLCTTRALAKGLQERFAVQFEPAEIQIAPNGADVERYERLPAPLEAREQLGLASGFTVGYTGHFYAGRGMDLLTEIARQMPQVNFLWVGGREEDIHPWQERLSQQAITNVTITGFIPNSRLPLYQAAADVLVMPYGKKISGSSGGEISKVINPMKMFDYMACGRPIIASNLPVFHEVLREDFAILCGSQDPSSWVSAIHSLQVDAARCLRMGARAREEARQYTWEKRAQTTISKLEKSLE